MKSRSRVNSQSAWFVNDKQVFILVSNVEVHCDGLDSLGSGFGRFLALHFEAFVEHEASFVNQSTFDHDTLGLDHLGNLRPTVLRHHPDQEHVQPFFLVCRKCHKFIVTKLEDIGKESRKIGKQSWVLVVSKSMRLYVSCLTAIGLATLGSVPVLAQDAEKQVNINVLARPASQLLANLSTEFGVTLTCEPEVAPDILAVHLDKANLETAKSLIANAVQGEWERKGDGWMLVHSRAETNKLVADEIAGKAEQYKKKLGKPASGKGANSEMVRSVLSTFNIKDLASIQPSRRVVFAPAPTQMQRPMPGQAVGIIQNAVRTQAGQNNDPRNARLRQTYLVAFGTGNGLQCQVFTVTGQNNVNAEAYYLDYSAPTADPTAAKVSNPAKISLSNFSKTMVKALLNKEVLDNTSNLSAFEDVTDASGNKVPVRTLISRPDLYDPMIPASELLVKSAIAEKVQMVALIPDQEVSLMMQAASNDSMTVADFVRSLTAQRMKLTIQNGTWVVRPLDVLNSRRKRVDRTALANMISEAYTTKNLKLESIGRYASISNSDGRVAPNELVYLSAANVTAASKYQEQIIQPDLMRLFYAAKSSGLLDRATSMLDPKTIQSSPMISGLPKLASDSVFSLVFNSPDGPSVSQRATRANTAQAQSVQGQLVFETTIQLSPSTGFASTRMFAQTDQERTIVLPTGIPGTGKLAISKTSSNMVAAYTSKGTAPLTTSIEQIAASKAYADSGLSGPNRNPEYQLFKVVGSTTYIFLMYLTDTITMTRMVQDTAPPTDNNFYLIDQLPQDMKDRYYTTYQRTLDAYRKANNGGGGGTRKVPPAN